MKKLLLILFMLPFLLMGQTPQQNHTFTVNAATKAVERVYADGTKVVEKTYGLLEKAAPKVEKALEQLGSSLKVSAGQVWDILVKQQLVWSIGFAVLTLSTILSWVHFYYRINVWQKDRYSDSHVGLIIFSAVISVAGTVCSTINFPDMLTGFINPEFGAMKTIAEIAAQIK